MMCIFLLLCPPILQTISLAPAAGAQLVEYSGDFAYGLVVIPPWPNGGKLVINLPEHLEYGDNGEIAPALAAEIPEARH